MSSPTPDVVELPADGGRRFGEDVHLRPDVVQVPAVAAVRWIEVFETGNAEIDALHRRLVEDCDRLMAMISKGAAWPLIVAEAKQLVADCIAHFHAEDALLESVEFPRRAAHAAEHRRIEQELQKLVASMEQVDGSLSEHRALPASLGPSLIDLIIRHDLDYYSHVQYQQGR